MVASQLSIDILKERMLSLAQAAKLFPPARRGRPVTPNAIWRWVSTGVRLASGTVVRLGGSWYTSREALQRFAEALTNGSTETVRGDTPRQRAADADEELRRLGI